MPGEQSELRHVSCYSYYVAAPQGLTLWSLLLTRHCFSAELNQVVMAMSDWATKDDSPPPLGVVPEGCWHESLGPLLSQAHPSVPRK